MSRTADRPINRQTVLLVGGESAIVDALAPYLEHSGFSVVIAHGGAEGLDIHEEVKLDIVVTDVMIPQPDGRQLVREIRTHGEWAPTVLLAQIDQSYKRSATLDEGMDDYLSKPFDPQELVSRIRAILRRTVAVPEPYSAADRLVCGNLVLDRVALRVFLKAREVTLTPKTSMLLDYLMTHPDELRTREWLLAALWGIDFAPPTRAVGHRICEIRRVLSDGPTQPTYIEMVPSVKYRLIGAARA